jgi:ribose transport system ATP-binding protein
LGTIEGMSSVAAPPLLEMKGITKSFPGVRALQSVDLHVAPGEVLALLGANGAGKSTLIKVLGGACMPDAGDIFLQGNPISIRSPQDAQQAGIGVIHQEFNLVPALSARENIFLGSQSAWSWFNPSRERKQAAALFERVGVSIDPEQRCDRLSVAQQQIVEIARALNRECQVLVMDEPTAALSPAEVQRLFGMIRDLTKRGIAIIYISHRLDEVFEIADRMMVMRDGCHVLDAPKSEMNRDRLIEAMVGRSLDTEFPKINHTLGEVVLEVTDLSRGDRVRGVSFVVHSGEVLGITGLVGAPD